MAKKAWKYLDYITLVFIHCDYLQSTGGPVVAVVQKFAKNKQAKQAGGK